MRLLPSCMQARYAGSPGFAEMLFPFDRTFAHRGTGTFPGVARIRSSIHVCSRKPSTQVGAIVASHLPSTSTWMTGRSRTSAICTDGQDRTEKGESCLTASARSGPIIRDALCRKSASPGPGGKSLVHALLHQICPRSIRQSGR